MSTLAATQGAFYLATGVWPLLHYRSFEWVTGPKREPWLVKTVGVLVGALGAVLLGSAWRRRQVPAELGVLGALSAAGLGAIELWYAGGRRRISPVYLADALLEAGLVAGWWRALRRTQPSSQVASAE